MLTRIITILTLSFLLGEGVAGGDIVAMSASQEACVDCGFQLVVAGTFDHAGGGSKGGVKSTRRKFSFL